MLPRDILDHRAAYADAVVPGHWLLDLPPDSPAVYVRRYHAVIPRIDSEVIPAAESSTDALKRATARLKAQDELELAWRGINELVWDQEHAEVRKVLNGACAIVVPPAADTGDTVKELWVFDTAQTEGSAYEQLTSNLQRVPHIESFSITDMLICASHGQCAACTRSMPAHASASPCRISFRPGAHATEWDLFTRSIVEKMSWQAGKRISMTPTLDGENRPPRATLSPCGLSQLLLRIQDSQSPTTRQVPSYRTLRPLRLSAYFVSPHHATPEQRVHLEDSFIAALGTSWSTGRAAWRLAQQATGRPTCDWGIYWVPLPGGASGQSPQAITSPTNNSRISLHDPSEGVLTVWPAHLASDQPHEARTAPVKKRKRRLVRPDQSTPANMLGVAAGLFDFFATYKPPPLPEEVAEEPSIELVMPPVLEIIPNGGNGDGDAGSDSDELFQSRSPSPAPRPEINGTRGSNGMASAAMDGMGSRQKSPPRIVLGDDVDMDAVNTNSPPRVFSSKVSSVGNDEYGAVTEDDFNFFDSPDKTADEPELQQKDEASGPGDGSGQGKEADQKAEGTDGPTSPEVPVHVKDFAFGQEQDPMTLMQQGGAAPATNGGNGTAIGEERLPSQEPADHDEGAQDVEAVQLAVSPTTVISNGATGFIMLSPTIDPSPKPSDISDLIPPDFSPLPLESIRILSSSLNRKAPATYYPTLRSELLARLRDQYNKSTKDTDYRLGWKVGDEMSEDDEEELGTDAPATPESSDMWDESTVASEDKVETVGSKDVEYDGMPCIGAEWFWARGDKEVLGALKRKWKDAWGTLPRSGVQEEQAGPRVAENGLERMAREVISNRYYRQPQCNGRPRQTHGLSSDGARLADLLGHWSVTDLADCNVHAGFAGNVMRLSIAGLGFWRQLGLTPVGGEKDVTSVAVRLPGVSNMRMADELLKGVERAWTALRLGTHKARAQSSVVITELQNFGSTINLLIKSHPEEDLAIYVLLDRHKMYDPSIMAALSTVSHSPNQMIHLVPTDSLHAQHYAHIAMDVYNRVSRKIDPFTPDLLNPPPPKPAFWSHYPSFTLAPDSTPRPEFTPLWPMRSYDVMNRWRWVHVGYAWLAERQTIVAFSIDAEGDNWDVGVYQGGMADALDWLWSFVVDFAAKTAIEWRVSLARLSIPDSSELEALDQMADGVSEPITTLFVEHYEKGTGVVRAPVPPANISQLMLDPSSSVVDAALSTKYAKYQHRIPVQMPPHTDKASADGGAEAEEIYPMSSWTSNIATATSDHLSSTYHLLSHRPAPMPGRTEESIADLLAREYQKLTYLARLRFGFEDAGLPVHLQAVKSVVRALGMGDV